MTGGTSLKDKSASVSKGDKLEGLDPTEKQLELWKMKRLVRTLKDARGNGTSMISLVLGPKDQVSRVASMLVDEYGTASNIKSRVNKLSVLSAITSAQQRLKLYSSTPSNGLVLYVGTVLNDDGKEKKVTVDLEPFRPVRTSLYMCDSRFHTEPLEALLQADDAKYGLVVMDGKGACFYTVCGSARELLARFTVDLPKKHGRGGQSAPRFARIRDEKRHNYVRKVAETATQLFITNDMPNVSGLVMAGSADFKTELSQSDLFDQRLRSVVLAVVDVAYGGDNGANQALCLASPSLSNVRIVREKQIIGQYFESIGKDDGLCAVGAKETMCCLEAGAVHTLLVWEKLPSTLCCEFDENTGDLLAWRQTSKQNESHQEQQHSLLDWLIDHGHKKYGCAIELVTDNTQEGSQFCKGFGGLGALLRYRTPSLTEIDLGDDADSVRSEEDEEGDFFI